MGVMSVMRINHGSSDRVLRVRARLTDRDQLLLDWLADHHVLTTPQIAHALFPSLDFAQRRLLTLHHLGLIDRFRPLRPGGGSYPWHHTLDHTGALFVAATRHLPPPRPADTRLRKQRIAASRTLHHRLGVNTFFTALAGHARTHPNSHLDRWWSETQCAAPGAFAPTLISPVRPDGHGIWTQDGQRLAFFLEHDTGTESHRVLLAKLHAYTAHIARGGPAWPVLLHLPTTARERHLHHLLDTLTPPLPPTLTIATTTPRATGTTNTGTTITATTGRALPHPHDPAPVQASASLDPTGRVWLVHRGIDAPRRLIDLATLPGITPAPDLW
jgi:hypothetical protein